MKVSSASPHITTSVKSPTSGSVKVEHTSTSAKSSPRKSLTVKIPGRGTWHLRADGSRAREGEGNEDDPFVESTTPTYRPRPDRPNNIITNNTAQAYYGTEACIFVAKYVHSRYHRVFTDETVWHNMWMMSNLPMLSLESSHVLVRSSSKSVGIVGACPSLFYNTRYDQAS